jgi:predicted nucleic acid-binding protein
VSYLVDTDRVVDYLKGTQPARDLFAVLTRAKVGLSLITYGEIYQRISFSLHDQSAQEASFLDLLRVVEVIGLNEEIMRRYAYIRGTLRRDGTSIGDPDILIAATALQYDPTPVTRNLDHFQRTPDLKLHDTG